MLAQFTVQKEDLSLMKAQESVKPSLQEGEVLFKIQRYALTANNLTYAVLGYQLKYWNFFPATDPSLGIIPVWGFGEVIESAHTDISVGEKFYGYFPMAQYLKVEADKVSQFGFADKAAHRQEMASIYNYYNRTATDLTYQADLEDFIPILKPLFVTSFLNYHFLLDADFHSSKNIILTSASSKTALGLAFMLKQSQPTHQKKIIALTSAANTDFVQQTGYYDQVYTYQALGELALADSLVIDFAGNAATLHALSEHLGEYLRFVSLVGIADWKAERNFREIPRAAFFFAPAFAKEKYAEWGVAQTNQKIAEYFFNFIEDMKSNIEINYLTDATQVTEVYQQMIAGKLDPSKGYIVK